MFVFKGLQQDSFIKGMCIVLNMYFNPKFSLGWKISGSVCTAILRDLSPGLSHF